MQVRNGPVGMAALSSGESLLHWARCRRQISVPSPRRGFGFRPRRFINRLTGAFAANPKIKTPGN